MQKLTATKTTYDKYFCKKLKNFLITKAASTSTPSNDVTQIVVAIMYLMRGLKEVR